MKRLLAIMLVTLTLTFTLTACSDNPPPPSDQPPQPAAATMTGKIVQLDADTCLLAGAAANDLYTLAITGAVYDSNNQAQESTALQLGQTVEVGYSGNIQETYPAQIGTPDYIKIMAPSNDLVGFYQSVLKDLWDTDPGLNANIKVLAFDLTKVTNLTAGEKEALVYLVSNEHQVEGLSATFEELEEQGYIDPEALYFEQGLLIILETTATNDNDFTFNAQKWRSGLGAYFYNDCQAVKSEDGWSYTIGSEAIS